MTEILSSIIIFILVFASCESLTKVPQQELGFSITPFSELPDTIRECSGISIDKTGIYVINDGGSGPILFHINESGDDTLDVIDLVNIENVDWEAIVLHEDGLIICDFGNNLGQRRDLTIYHVDKADYSLKDKIEFSYPNQLSFDNPKHNFDCEGMVILDDEYVLFTKNRGNKNTNVYTSALGESNFVLRDSIPVPGMITDATFHQESNSVILLSYNYSVLGGFQSHLTIVKPYDSRKFKPVKSFDIEYREQFEAIDHLDGSSFLIGSENVYAKGGNLYKVTFTGLN